MIRKALLTIPLLLLPLSACKKGEEAPPSAPAPEAGASTAPTAPEAGGAPVGPISSRGDKVAEAPPMGGTTQEGTLQFDIPPSWRSEPPSNNMRVAQASISGPGGPGDLVVFYFGPGGGGGVEANIQRWIDQMDPEPGSDPKPETFDANGYKVTWIDIAGTLKPSSMGMGPAVEQPNARLLGAVVEGPGGPWFFKATGPDATLTAERDNFLKMLRSVRAK